MTLTPEEGYLILSVLAAWFAAIVAYMSLVLDRRDRKAQLDLMNETIETMKLDLELEEARIIRYVRPGGYGGSIYSIRDSSVNILSIDSSLLFDIQGPQFLYIWPCR